MNTEPETTAQPIAPEVLTPKAESAAIVPPPAGKPKRKPSVPLHPAVIAYLAEQARRGCNGGTAGRGACKRRGDRAHYARIARLAMLKRWGGPAGLAKRAAKRAKVAAPKAESATVSAIDLATPGTSDYSVKVERDAEGNILSLVRATAQQVEAKAETQTGEGI